MLRILHISDFHLVAGKIGLSAVFAFLSQQGFPVLSQYYSFADQIIQRALPIELTRVAAGVPSVLALTGDIAAWPGDSSTLIDAHYYPYVASLESSLPLSSVILPVLGNHDWQIGVARSSPFIQTQFQQNYDIVNPRIFLFSVSNVHAIFLLIDTSMAILPATGEVSPHALSFLQNSFAEGRAGNLGISADKYSKAIKLLILHHSPLPPHAYGGLLSRRDARSLELTNAVDLLRLCKDDLDVLLFGHTHVATAKSFEGFVTIDAGTTMARTRRSEPCTLHVIDLLDKDTIVVQPLHWIKGAFTSQGYHPITFRRGYTTSPVLGSGRWG
jgi:3',5'-cyclic AMP phosphodiesterase CpdA